jgi:hypothetical protein
VDSGRLTWHVRNRTSRQQSVLWKRASGCDAESAARASTVFLWRKDIHIAASEIDRLEHFMRRTRGKRAEVSALSGIRSCVFNDTRKEVYNPKDELWRVRLKKESGVEAGNLMKSWEIGQF